MAPMSQEQFDTAAKAFSLFTREEKLRALHHFAGLRYPSIAERFFDSCHHVIAHKRKSTAAREAHGTDADPLRPEGSK